MTNEMSKEKADIKIKIKEIESVWNKLSDLITLNENPFNGYARQLLFKMQPEIKFKRQSSPGDGHVRLYAYSDGAGANPDKLWAKFGNGSKTVLADTNL